MVRHRQLKPKLDLNRPFSFRLWHRLKHQRRVLILTIERSCTRSFDLLVQDRQELCCRSGITPFSMEFEPQTILYGFESCMGQIPLGWARSVVNVGGQCCITTLSSSCARIGFSLVQDNTPIMAHSQVSPNLERDQHRHRSQSVAVVLCQEFTQPGTRLNAFAGETHA
jgi:hypothetical protein